MKTAGIICECNPMHAGHVYLMNEARRGGADAIVCVMSGCFVQRGEAAIADPYARAEILVRAGADAVVELPFPYSAASAEFFGAAGVDILSRLGIDELWFGSECGDLALLSRMADAADDPAFLASYTETARGNGGTARAYFDCLQAFCGADACSPNDILAVSYLRAIKKCARPMHPVTVKRQGSGYSETVLKKDTFPSATALRRAWHENGLAAILPHLPVQTAEILLREEANGRAPASLSHAERLILGTLRTASAEALERCDGLSGGLAGRLKSAAENAKSLEELLSLAATKKYPDARLRRAVLAAMIGVTPEDVRENPAYVRLLAANKAGCAYLSQKRRAPEIAVITRQGELPSDAVALRQQALEKCEKSLYSLCLPDIDVAKTLLCHAPVIL